MNATIGPRFSPYDGPRTGAWARWSVIPRYGYRQALASKMTLVLLVLACFMPAVAIAATYARHNAQFLRLFGPEIMGALALNTDFLIGFLMFQAWLAFFLALWIGPPLLIHDTANNALPLYLARPLSRAHYVSGKLAVLVGPLSLMTWGFGLLVVGVQVAFEPAWLADHGREVAALVLGAMVFVAVLSLITLAVASLLRRAWLARGLLFGALIVLRGLAGIINDVFDTALGALLAPTQVLILVWSGLFGHGAWFGVLNYVPKLPVWTGWLILGLACLASVLVLRRRIQAYEVVR